MLAAVCAALRRLIALRRRARGSKRRALRASSAFQFTGLRKTGCLLESPDRVPRRGTPLSVHGAGVIPIVVQRLLHGTNQRRVVRAGAGLDVAVRPFRPFRGRFVADIGAADAPYDRADRSGDNCAGDGAARTADRRSFSAVHPVPTRTAGEQHCGRHDDDHPGSIGRSHSILHRLVIFETPPRRAREFDACGGHRCRNLTIRAILRRSCRTSTGSAVGGGRNGCGTILRVPGIGNRYSSHVRRRRSRVSRERGHHGRQRRRCGAGSQKPGSR